jgi:hypothetical protein
MMNSWTSFLTWTIGVLLAVKYQFASTKISSIIEAQSLAGITSKRRIYIYFGILYVLSCGLLVSFNVFCAKYQSQRIREDQTWFVGFATMFLVVLFVAYLYSFS